MKGISNALQIEFNIIKNGDDILYACQMITCVKNDVDPSFDHRIAGVSRPFPAESEPGNGVYHYVRQQKHDGRAQAQPGRRRGSKVTADSSPLVLDLHSLQNK